MRIGDVLLHVCFDTGRPAIFVCIGVEDYGDLGCMSFWNCSVCGSTRAGSSLGLAY